MKRRDNNLIKGLITVLLFVGSVSFVFGAIPVDTEPGGGVEPARPGREASVNLNENTDPYPVNTNEDINNPNPVNLNENTDPYPVNINKRIEGDGRNQIFQQRQANERKKISNPLDDISSVSGFIKALADVFFQLAYSIAVLFLIYAGFLFVTAGGSVEKIEKAKKVFLWTVVGTAIVLGADVIADIVDETIRSLNP